MINDNATNTILVEGREIDIESVKVPISILPQITVTMISVTNVNIRYNIIEIDIIDPFIMPTANYKYYLNYEPNFILV
jgi:hypothetical protein